MTADVMYTEATARRRKHGVMRAGGDIAELEALAPLHPEHAGSRGPSGESVTKPVQRRATVAVTSPRQPLEAGQEALGRGRRGRFREDVLQTALRVGLCLALRAGGQMREHTLARLMTELTVDQRGKSVSQMLFCEVPLGGFGPCSTHADAPPPPSTGTRAAKERRSARASGDRCAKALRSCERPR